MFKRTARILHLLPAVALTLLAGACTSDVMAPVSRDLGSPSRVTLAATPTLLVNTGPGEAAVGYGLFGGDPGFPGYQFIGGQFSLSSDADIVSVAGWMRVYLGGNVDVHIRANSGGLPGADLHSQTYTPTTTTGFDWYQFPNFTTTLAAGTYWLTFEPVINGGFFASMPNAAASPLSSYAYKGNYTFPNWSLNFGSPTPTMGFQVAGSIVTPVTMIGGLQGAITAATLPAGTTNSLNAKLNAALAAIAANQTAGACSALQDVLNFTRAQYGKKIPVAVADDIIAQTNAIRSKLGC